MTDTDEGLVEDAVHGTARAIVENLPEGVELEAWYEPGFHDARKLDTGRGKSDLNRFLDTYGPENLEYSDFYARNGGPGRGRVLKGEVDSPYQSGVEGRFEVWARVDKESYEEALEEAGVP